MGTNDPTSGTRPPRTVWLWMGGAAAVGALAALLVMPAPPDTDVANGDPDLAAEVADLLPEDSAVGVSVALIDGDEVTRATLGTTDGSTPVQPDTAFETGSVQKTLTGTLLADMVRTGDVELDTTLDEIWTDVDFADDNVAGITLEQLATHHAGLPNIHSDIANFAALSLHNYFGTDPYRWESDPVEAAAGLTDEGPNSDTGHSYSNLGFSLLGQSLAEVSGKDYPALLTERVLEPLGMAETTLLTSPEVPPNGAEPHRNPWIRVQPSFNPPNAPSGVGTWSTSGDMVTLLRAGMAQDFPALATAQEPRVRGNTDSSHDERVGLAWIRWNVNDTELTWHNGGTAGSRSYVAHTDDGRGVVVLANSARVPADTIGLKLLDPDMPESDSSSNIPFLATALSYVFGAGAPFVVLLRMARQRVTSWTQQLDKVAVVGTLLTGAALWTVSFRLGDADLIPAVWAVGAGALAAAVPLGAWRWRGLPRTRGPRPWWRWIDLTVYLVLVAAVFTGTLWALWW
ncbi:CubicO group peptidase (beta-lactamase class C family) [Lipingzhangella halophila]|uniref:CubicO group peptidase (Beta-lactamase class C family) n=1 Tax=Lipingzhangella halophila TaxID=1783352 RepID=A0A7W7W323_9ACTN|nr:serine hydrolase domain-containing protein [Lipingzhangella halophila]MBB4932053.1 CubicO group peptidase (beta-lactamase class C family) [Lipingzhangella halophila]